MIVLVCGGRDYADRKAIQRTLVGSGPLPSLVIHGGALGADYLAAEVAAENGIHCAEVEALWDHYGKAAGPLRNAAMLRLRPDKVIAFSGGRGTENCVAQAEEAGIPVERISDA